MGITAEEFLKTAKKRVSKLEPFKDDIIKLKQEKVSNIDIVRFLELNGVRTSQSNVCKYLKTIQSDLEQAKPKKVHTIKAHAKSLDISQTKDTQESKKKPLPSWASKDDVDDLF